MGESMPVMFLPPAYLTPDSDVGVSEMPAVPVAVGAQDLLGELDRPAYQLAVQLVLAFDSSSAAVGPVPVPVLVPAGEDVERSSGTD
jgi:hypothetical protein